MKRALACVATSALTVLGALLLPTPVSSGSVAVAAAAPLHTLSVTGPGLALAPAYDAATSRYAVRTTAASTGALTVHATTADPGGTVRVDGRPVVGDSAALTGVEPGDEVSVMYDDAGGHAVHSLIVLPPTFPALVGTGPAPGLAEGELLLTLNSWNADPERFHAVVDDYGVPRWFRRMPMSSHDFRVQENGSMTWSEPATTQAAGNVIVEHDDRFQEVARHQTVDLVNTDFHDSLLRTDGSRVHMAYEYDVPRIVTDSVIQEIDADGSVFQTWSTEDHVDRHAETVVDVGDPFARMDYSHLNSVTITPDGDYLASFRHLSSVFKIARTAHDGYEQGEVIWRLGGRKSDFSFVDDPYGGPCAQHTATMLPNGDVMVFDNGSIASDTHTGFCVDPADPAGETVARPVSRYVRWELDEDAMTATMVAQYAPGHFAPFTGSAFPLGNGNTLIGWGAADTAVATEISPAGVKLWELTTPSGQGSYRVYRADVRDAFEPVVDLVAPAEGATYTLGQPVRADYGCTDRGGSNLVSCSGPAASGGQVDTQTPGTGTFEVIAVDGDGNRTVARRTYTVLAAPKSPPAPTPAALPTPPAPAAPPGTARADLAVKVGSGPYTGTGRFLPERQQGRARLPLDGVVRARVRLENAGAAADAFRLSATPADGVRARWYLGADDVTRALRKGLLATSELDPGEVVHLRLVLEPARQTEPGDRVALRVVARPLDAPDIRDRVRLEVRVRSR